jgi:hypothetical protein
MSCNGEWYNLNDGRSMRKGWAAPACQITDYDCGVYATRQIIYQLLDWDLSETNMLTWAVNSGITSTNGTGPDGIEKLLDHFSEGKIGYYWKYYSELKMAGLNDIMNDRCRSFITHTMLRSAWGHWQNIIQVGVNQDDLYERYSVGNCQLKYLPGSTYREWISGISGASILVCYLK